MAWNKSASWNLLAGIAALLAWPAHVEPAANNPYYTAASIVNAATNQSGHYAPNSIITIYGTGLSFDTMAVDAGYLQNGALPLEMAGVHVIIDGLSAGLYYVSPTQINALVPNDLLPGASQLVVVRNGLAGLKVPLPLDEVAPGLFTNPDHSLLATHSDGRLISPEAPVVPDEWVVLYCEGLGRTIPDLYNGEIAVRAQPIVQLSALLILVDGVALPPHNLYYAGVAPGFAGLYQVNVKMPSSLGHNPEIRFGLGPQMSPAQTFLPAY